MKKRMNSLLTICAAVALIILFGSQNLNAQETKNELKEKIKKVKGEIEKIIITADGEDYEFEGELAKKLFMNMKSKLDKKNNIILEVLKEGDDKNVWITKGDHAKTITAILEDEIVWNEESEDGETVKKEIKIDIEDGEKKVTVTTTKDGEETTEVFEGDEAEEFLKKNKHGKHLNIKILEDISIDRISDGDAKVLMIMEELEGDSEANIKIEIDTDGDEKVITVTTTKDGEEEVKVYKGKEADEYLKQMEKDGKCKVKFLDKSSNALIFLDEEIEVTEDGNVKRIEIKIDDSKKNKKVDKIFIKKKSKKKDDDK